MQAFRYLKFLIDTSAQNALTVFLLSLFAILPCSGAYANTVLAETSEDGVEIVKVTGLHIDNPAIAANLPKATITQKDITALTTTSLAEVLRTVPGLDITQQGGLSGLTFLSLRGGDANYAVVLINGVKVNDPTNSRGGGFDINAIDPDLIERIEIYYGSNATVFGTDALSGVISITTKGEDFQNRTQANLRMASEETSSATLQFSKVVSSNLGANIIATRQNNDNSTFGDDYSRSTAIANIGGTYAQGSSWKIGGFYAKGRASGFPEDSGAELFASIRTPEARGYEQRNLSSLIDHRWNKKLSTRIDFTIADRQENADNPGIAEGVLDAIPPLQSQTDFRRTDASLLLTYKASDDLSAAAGMGTSKENGELNSIIDFGVLIDANFALKRSIDSLYGELVLQALDDVNIVLGARHDSTQSRSINSYRVFSTYALNGTTQLNLHYSEGFKLPSLFALGHPLVGNAELEAETSKTIELSVARSFISNKLRTVLNLYENRYQDLIDFDPIAFTNVNRKRITVRGAEVSMDYSPNSDFAVKAQVTHSEADTNDQESALRRRTDWKGSATVSYAITPAILFSSGVFYNNGYIDSSIPTGLVDISNFTLWSASMRWQVAKNTSLRVNLENVLDSKHQEAVGFLNPGRAASATISVTL